MVQWLRMQVLGMDVPGLNTSKFCFYDIFLYFCTPFYPVLTALLEYLNPAILHLFGFCFITLLL